MFYPMPCSRCGISCNPIPSFIRHSSAYVHSSKVFSLDEIQETSQTIKRIDAAILQVDGDINHLENHLAILRVRQADLVTALTTHQSIVAPIRKLIPEIIEEIFSHCGLTPSISEPLFHETGEWSEWTIREYIGKVCQLWRDILNSTPRLWSDIRLTKSKELALTPASEKQRTAIRLREALDLSSAHPLALYVDGTSFTTEVMNLLIPHSDRWQQVKLGNLRSPWFFPKGLPLLQYLDISGLPAQEISITSAPNLRFVEMATFPALIELPWTNIACITILHAKSGWYDIVNLCSHLQEFRITLGGDWLDGDIAASNVCITSRSLRKLKVTVFADSVDRIVFDSLTLPNLSDLDIFYPPRGGWGVPPTTRDSDFTAQISMINRSGCAIKSLRVVGADEPESLISLLEVCDELTQLTLQFGQLCKDVNPLLASLINLPHAAILIPNLTQLSITFEFSPMTCDSLVDVIDSRWHSSAFCLRTAIESLEPSFNPDDVQTRQQRLRNLVSTGCERPPWPKQIQSFNLWIQSGDVAPILTESLEFLRLEGLKGTVQLPHIIKKPQQWWLAGGSSG